MKAFRAQGAWHEYKAVASALEAIEDELRVYGKLPDDDYSYDNPEPSELLDGAYRVFDVVNDIVSIGGPTAILRPQLGLTRAMHAALRYYPKLPEVSSYGCTLTACFQAELYFARSLIRLGNLAAGHASDCLPAAILYDADGAPYAYQKADGIHSAYAWRDAKVETNAGVQYAPKGSLLQLLYGRCNDAYTYYEDDPRCNYPGLGLVALKQAPKPDSLRILRFSTSHLPLPVRALAHTHAEESQYDIYQSLQPYLPLALQLSPERMAAEAALLMGRGLAQVV